MFIASSTHPNLALADKRGSAASVVKSIALLQSFNSEKTWGYKHLAPLGLPADEINVQSSVGESSSSGFTQNSSLGFNSTSGSGSNFDSSKGGSSGSGAPSS